MSLSGGILIVDDSPLDAELILQALIGNEVCSHAIHVREGAEALDFLYCQGHFTGRSSVQPELVFLDLQMPGKDGMEVLRQIRGDDRFKAMTVVMFTSAQDEIIATRARELGVSLLIRKPVDYNEYVRLVKSAVGRVLNLPA